MTRTRGTAGGQGGLTQQNELRCVHYKNQYVRCLHDGTKELEEERERRGHREGFRGERKMEGKDSDRGEEKQEK